MINVHPFFLVILVMWIASGQVGLYAIMMISLLWHELGHLLFAKCCGVSIRQITLLPFGGRIMLGPQASYLQRVIIACGGPFFTWIAYVVGDGLSGVWQTHWQQMQITLLLVNLLPIYPLDGGQIICHSLLTWRPKLKIYETYLSLSFYFITIIVGVILLMLPQTIFLAVLGLFLWLEVLGEWKIRKYRLAYEKIVMNRLT